MPKRRGTDTDPKRVVYLWGAGATQAEVSYLGAATVNVLMRDVPELGAGVASRVLGRLDKKWRSAFSEDRESDIEKLISLLVATRVDRLLQLADRIRRLYFF